MACPTCDDEMIQMADTTLLWCPCCGTIKWSGKSSARPVLVDRCRNFEKKVLPTTGKQRDKWRKFVSDCLWGDTDAKVIR